MLSTHIPSFGIEADPFAVVYYEPAGSALNQVPGEGYTVTEVYGELVGPPQEGGNYRLLPLMLDQIQDVFGQADFAIEFRNHFETYLLDVDPDTDGAQRYFNCDGLVVDTLEQAFWCGPAQTWPQELYNHAYIEFWHHLDAALSGEIAGVNVDQLADLGPALINDEAWTSLFGLGQSSYDGITVNLNASTLSVGPLSVDQLGNPRPADVSGDIGAVELGD